MNKECVLLNAGRILEYWEGKSLQEALSDYMLIDF